jgi:hypothetical protein
VPAIYGLWKGWKLPKGEGKGRWQKAKVDIR